MHIFNSAAPVLPLIGLEIENPLGCGEDKLTIVQRLCPMPRASRGEVDR